MNNLWIIYVWQTICVLRLKLSIAQSGILQASCKCSAQRNEVRLCFSITCIDVCFLEFSRRLGLIVNWYLGVTQGTAEQRYLSSRTHARYYMRLYQYHTMVWGHCVTRHYRCTLWYYWRCGLCWLNVCSLQPLLLGLSLLLQGWNCEHV